MVKKKCNILKLWFDRLLSRSLMRQLAVLAVVLVCLFGLSYLLLSLSGSDWRQFCKEERISEWLLPLYLLIDTNALNNLYMGSDGTYVEGWMLFASCIIYVMGVFIFNGMIISVMTNTFSRRESNHREGRTHYLISGHYIVMGYDETVPSIIAHVFEKDPKAYVLLLTAMDVVQIHEKLKKSFTHELMKRIIINYGHRTTTEDYRNIHVEGAEEIYIVGIRELNAHDAINVECVDSICKYMKTQKLKNFKHNNSPQRIVCFFNDLDTYSSFKTTEIFKEVRELEIEFIPYNFYTGWAKQVFVKRFHRDNVGEKKEICYPAVYGKDITPDGKKYAHLVFVGTSNFGVAFAMEAANLLHFPNYAHNPQLKTRITFIDLHADKEKDEFITRNRHFFEIQAYTYRDLSSEKEKAKEREGIRMESMAFTGEAANFLDVEFEFIKGDVFSRNVQAVISEWAKDSDNQYLSIFLAMSDQRKNFAFGMNMPDEVYDNKVPIFIRQDRSDNFVTNLRTNSEEADAKKSQYFYVESGSLKQETRVARYANIYPFGMEETGYCADEASLRRAKLINYLYNTANDKTCQFTDIQTLQSVPVEEIWAKANELWNQLSVALKWSNLYNAYAIRTKVTILRAMRGLELDDDSLDKTPLSEEEASELAVVEHNRWNVEKLLMGYRKPHIQEDKYLHPEYAEQLKKNKNCYIHHDIRPHKELDIVAVHDKEFSIYIPWILSMTENL